MPSIVNDRWPIHNGVAGGAATQYVHALGTHPLAAARNSTAWEYLLPDALGSVRQLADGGGQITLARDTELWNLLHFASSIEFRSMDANREGNSLQDLRLSLKEFRFANWVHDNNAVDPVWVGAWLRMILRR